MSDIFEKEKKIFLEAICHSMKTFKQNHKAKLLERNTGKCLYNIELKQAFLHKTKILENMKLNQIISFKNINKKDNISRIKMSHKIVKIFVIQLMVKDYYRECVERIHKLIRKTQSS